MQICGATKLECCKCQAGPCESRREGAAMSRIDEIRAREQAATGYKWLRKNGQILCPLGSGDLLKMGGGFDENDAEFVAHSREDIPYVLNENAKLLRRCGALEHKISRLTARLEALGEAHVDMTCIIQGAAYERCDYCILKTEPCPASGLNAECCFEYAGLEEQL